MEPPENGRAVTCYRCTHVNAPGRGTCRKCGAHLFIRCKDCGARNPRIQPLCLECGRRMHRSALSKFRAAFKRRRCLVVTDGFYEWRTPAAAAIAAGDAATPSKKKSPKQPFHIHFPDRRPFVFAGLWETGSKGEAPLETCTIITTSANGTMKPLHERMPVILDKRDYALWLSPEPRDPAILLELLKPCPNDWLTCEPVSTVVNNPRHDGPECMLPSME